MSADAPRPLSHRTTRDGRYVTGRLEDVRPHPDCLLIAIHACGPLTDFVIRLAVSDCGRSGRSSKHQLIVHTIDRLPPGPLLPINIFNPNARHAGI